MVGATRRVLSPCYRGFSADDPASVHDLDDSTRYTSPPSRSTGLRIMMMMMRKSDISIRRIKYEYMYKYEKNQV